MVTKSEIALIKSLTNRRSRYENGLFVVEGHKMVEEAIESELTVRQIFSSDQECTLDNCRHISPRDMERISSMKSSQGVLALVEIPRYDLSTNLGERLTIVLDGVQDPGNVGTIIRLADWFGIGDVVCSADSADCYNPKVVQATMGAIFRVCVHYAELPALLRAARGRGITIYGALLDGESIYSVDLVNPTSGVIVMGSEGGGITPQVESEIERRLSIPPYAPVATSESLNVAVATAIICSEFRRPQPNRGYEK